MASRTATTIRKNEDEKHEKIIRSLAKQTENRRCINCGSLGPQYICTNFATFVCTACSGVHREFTHRIKSISMAKFTSEEVHALQDGGNDRAREIFFRDLDPHKFPLPDPGNPDKLREFIKNVYIERRYTGERAQPPRRSERDDGRRPSPRRSSAQPSEVRSPRLDGGRGGSRYEEQMSDHQRSHQSRNSYDGSNDREGRYMGSPASVYSAPATISSDRGGGSRRSVREGDRERHDDRDGRDGREHRSSRHERDRERGDRDRDRDRHDERYDRKGGGEERREGRRSTTRGIDEFGSPPMQPVSAILGDAYASRSGRQEEDYHSPVHQKRSSRRSKTPTREEKGHQRVNSGNLIDWNAMDDPAPAPSAPAVDPFAGAGLSAAAAPAVDNGPGWATFGGAPGSTAPGGAPAPPSFDSTGSFGGNAFVASATNGTAGWGAFGPPQQQPMPLQQQQPAPMGVAAAGGQWSAFAAGPGPAGVPMPQQQWSSFPGSQPVAPQGPQFPQPQQQPQVQVQLQQPQPQTQPPPSVGGNRQEIPEDFFAQQQPSYGGSYSSAYGQMGMGPLSYQQGPPSYTAPPAPAPHPGQKTKNPFDLPGDSPPPGPSPAQAFPNMGQMQSALPNFQPGPFSNPAPPPGPPSSGNWGAATAPGLNFGPASYPGNATAGFATGPGAVPPTGFSQAPAFQQPSMGVNSMGAPGSFSGAPPSSYGGMQGQYGMAPPQQYPQQMPVVGNPFG